jgi:hypothetical protein
MNRKVATDMHEEDTESDADGDENDDDDNNTTESLCACLEETLQLKLKMHNLSTTALGFAIHGYNRSLQVLEWMAEHSAQIEAAAEEREWHSFQLRGYRLHRKVESFFGEQNTWITGHATLIARPNKRTYSSRVMLEVSLLFTCADEFEQLQREMEEVLHRSLVSICGM